MAQTALTLEKTRSPRQIALGVLYLALMGLVILLSIAASILPARNAARLTINEVLAYE